MKKINALVAASLVSFALIGCGQGSDAGSDANSEQTAEQATDPTDGTSEMMGGDDEQNAENLGTANGQDIDDVDVKMNGNMANSEEKMTGADEIEAQRPKPE